MIKEEEEGIVEAGVEGGVKVSYRLRLFMASNFYSKQRPMVQQKHRSRTARPPHPVYGPGDCLPSINSATVGEFDEELPVRPCIIKFFLNSRP